MWLIRVRLISLKDVVFLGMDAKEKLINHHARIYLGLIKWVFFLNELPNSLCFEIALLTELELNSLILGSSPISLISV